jgi:hypothetical protein
MRSHCVTALAFVATLAVPEAARADRRPTVATDGVYVGGRIEPGIALLAGWDLDIYLARGRQLSIGPGLSLAVFGTESNVAGRAQDLLLTVDVVRFKLGLGSPGAATRPFVMVGGGFSYVRLREELQHDALVLNADHTWTRGDVAIPAVDGFAPIATLGAGVDVFPDARFGFTALMAAHIHPIGSDRMPLLWFDMAVGFRFGL